MLHWTKYRFHRIFYLSLTSVQVYGIWLSFNNNKMRPKKRNKTSKTPNIELIQPIVSLVWKKKQVVLHVNFALEKQTLPIWEIGMAQTSFITWDWYHNIDYSDRIEAFTRLPPIHSIVHMHPSEKTYTLAYYNIHTVCNALSHRRFHHTNLSA